MKSRTRLAAVAVSGLLAVTGVAACSSSSSGGGGAQLVASVPNLTGVHTQVILDAGFVKALGTLKLTPGTIGSATLTNGTLSFPITGGSVKYYKPGSVSPYVTGTIDHNGSGISLTAGSKVVKLENFVVNPGTSELTGKVIADGKTLGDSIDLFFLNGKTLQPLQTGANNTAILYGTKVFLSSTAATTLDKFFGTTALSSSTLVGVARITINT